MNVFEFFIMMIGYLLALVMTIFWLGTYTTAKKYDATVFKKCAKKHIPAVRLVRSDGREVHEMENAGADGVHHSTLIKGLEFKIDGKGSGLSFKDVKVIEAYGGNAKPLTFTSKLGVTKLMKEMGAVTGKQAVADYMTIKHRHEALVQLEEIKEIALTVQGTAQSESSKTLGDLKTSIEIAFNKGALDEVARLEWENNIGVLQEMAEQFHKNGKSIDSVKLDDLLIHKEPYAKKLEVIKNENIFVEDGMVLYTLDVMQGMEGMTAHEFASSMLAAETKGEVNASQMTQMNKIEQAREMLFKYGLMIGIICAAASAIGVVALMFGPDFVRNARELTEVAGQTIANSQIPPP